ncbi:MAG: ABC transporter ATP-binding protein [Desulfomicrobium apsheronum]|nr:ABC transporter ATP-binding protein [Desulfomicrobium apsheronum]
MMSSGSLLTLRGVSHFFGSRLIFKGVSCELAPGSIMLVAGSNGAGKTTLLKIMAGLTPPRAGTVERTVKDRAMAFMGHQTFVYPALTALGNLEFWNSVYGRGLGDAALLGLLDRVGLKGFALESAGTFSRGMAQRLSLARVLLVEPALVFLDEPSTGLDTTSQALLHAELEAARTRGAGIVWISHDLDRDLGRADTVLSLGGRGMSYFGPAHGFAPEGP